jgi:hypothetical protein
MRQKMRKILKKKNKQEKKYTSQLPDNIDIPIRIFLPLSINILTPSKSKRKLPPHSLKLLPTPLGLLAALIA